MSIGVKVLLFASLADRLGVREVRLDLPLEPTADDALQAMADRYPDLAPQRDQLALAVNLTYVQPTHVLADGDELALIPPVSGG